MINTNQDSLLWQAELVSKIHKTEKSLLLHDVAIVQMQSRGCGFNSWLFHFHVTTGHVGHKYVQTVQFQFHLVHVLAKAWCSGLGITLWPVPNYTVELCSWEGNHGHGREVWQPTAGFMTKSIVLPAQRPGSALTSVPVLSMKLPFKILSLKFYEQVNVSYC